MEIFQISGFREAIMIESVRYPPSCPAPPYPRRSIFTLPFTSLIISVQTVLLIIPIVEFLILVRTDLNEETNANENAIIISTAAISIPAFKIFLAPDFSDFAVQREDDVKCLDIGTHNKNR